MTHKKEHAHHDEEKEAKTPAPFQHKLKLPKAGDNVVARELTVTFDSEGTRQTLSQAPDVDEETVEIAAPEEADLTIALVDISADGTRTDVLVPEEQP